MAKNYETYTYAGGIRNRISRITMRTSGKSTGHYMDGHTGQTYADHSVISRTISEPPAERNQQDGVKVNDV